MLLNIRDLLIAAIHLLGRGSFQNYLRRREEKRERENLQRARQLIWPRR